MSDHRIKETTLYTVENAYRLKNGELVNYSDRLLEKNPSSDDMIICECGAGPFDDLDAAEQHLRDATA